MDRRPAAPIPRPFAATVLGVLWLFAILGFVGGAGALALFGGFRGLALITPVVGGLVLAATAGALGWGLLARARWAYFGQLGVAVLGLFTPFVVPSALILMYMLRDEVRIAFSGRRDVRDLSADEVDVISQSRPEAAFTAAIVLALLASFVLSGLMVSALRRDLRELQGPDPARTTEAVPGAGTAAAR